MSLEDVSPVTPRDHREVSPMYLICTGGFIDRRCQTDVL